MTLKAVFFDLDGTLLDTSLDLGGALNTLRAEENLPYIHMKIIRQHVSNGATALLKLGFDLAPKDQAFASFRTRLLDHYLDHVAEHTLPFDGICDLIGTMHQHKLSWGVVTNKPALYTRALMKHMHFESPPAAVVSPDDVGVSKPDAKPLLHACHLAQCPPSEAIYVGDHQRDIECGHNAGMPTIAVGYGFTAHPDDYLSWQATHTANTAHDIWPIVQSYL